MGNNPSAMYASERHASLQNFDPVLVQLSGILSGIDLDLVTYYAVKTRLSLDIDDVYLDGEPITFRVKPENQSARLTATIEDVDTGTEVARTILDYRDEEWIKAEVPPLTPGTYRLHVQSGPSVDPVSDVFAVLAQP
jgi:hypothetical protein